MGRAGRGCHQHAVVDRVCHNSSRVRRQLRLAGLGFKPQCVIFHSLGVGAGRGMRILLTALEAKAVETSSGTAHILCKALPYTTSHKYGPHSRTHHTMVHLSQAQASAHNVPPLPPTSLSPAGGAQCVGPCG
jgi:hypothetical protein